GWYYVPLETTYLVLLCLGGVRLVARSRCWTWRWLPPPGPSSAVLGLILLTFVVHPQAVRYDWLPGTGRRVGSIHSEWEKIRERDYLRVGHDLRRATGGRALLAGPEIGALGYAYGGPILDTMGLISPEARAYHPLPAGKIAGNSAIPPDLIADRKPDLVVFLEIFGRRGLLRDPRFAASYHLWHRYPSHIFGSRDLLVFVQNGTVW
ncbi:MAG: hypothetical protein ACE5ID_00985, partial [Acidobacteriota bacterium]